MELKEGINFHIKEVGTSLELTSVTLVGFTAGVIDLTKRGFDINQSTVRSVGMLMMAKTMPVVKKSSVKKKTSKKTTKA